METILWQNYWFLKSGGLLSGRDRRVLYKDDVSLLHSSRAMQVDDEDEGHSMYIGVFVACFRQPLDIPGFDCNRGIYMHKA